MDRTYTPIAQYAKTNFASNTRLDKRIKHDVYSRGDGAPVVVIQELPGIGIETLQLADRLVVAGFQVVLPHLFGPLERTQMIRNLARVFCMRREFRLFAANESSPIVDWLKSLCQHVRTTNGARGVGVIGMCLTGNFAISLMADDSVLASVASQPSLPLGKQTSLHLSSRDAQQIKDRLEEVGPMIALRFEGDKFCTVDKFQCIDDTLNDGGTKRINLTTLPGNGHSVLTRDFVDQVGDPTREALDEVIDYFVSRLR